MEIKNKDIEKERKIISDLQKTIAEKEKEIKNLVLAHFESEINKPVLTTTQMINQDKISFAIAELEKVKEFCEKELKECDKLLKTEFEDDFYIQSVMARESMCFDFRRTIDSQIKQLKEKK